MTDLPTPVNLLDAAPKIELRVPGPWDSPQSLVGALGSESPDYQLDENALVHLSSGRRIALDASDHDDEIADVFAGTGRLSEAELMELASHRVKVHLSGTGGSAEAARAMMNAATALVRAGGTGVLIDSSAASHGRNDWLALAADKTPGGLYWAFVTVGGSDTELWSCGMHALGLRDAELFDPPDREWGGMFLHQFLGYAYRSGATLLDGEALGDETTALYRIRHHPCTRFAPGTPFHNPYGIWRLEKIDAENDEDADAND